MNSAFPLKKRSQKSPIFPAFSCNLTQFVSNSRRFLTINGRFEQKFEHKMSGCKHKNAQKLTSIYLPFCPPTPSPRTDGYKDRSAQAGSDRFWLDQSYKKPWNAVCTPFRSLQSLCSSQAQSCQSPLCTPAGSLQKSLHNPSARWMINTGTKPGNAWTRSPIHQLETTRKSFMGMMFTGTDRTGQNHPHRVDHPHLGKGFSYRSRFLPFSPNLSYLLGTGRERKRVAGYNTTKIVMIPIWGFMHQYPLLFC